MNGNQERNKFDCLLNWLDTKLEITGYSGHGITRSHAITRSELQKYVITSYFDCMYDENIDFVKQIKIFILRFQEKSKTIDLNISISNLDNNFKLSGY